MKTEHRDTLFDQRKSRRRRLTAPLTIDACDRPGRVGVVRNLSTQGVLFSSVSRFAVGERLILKVYLNGHTQAALAGRVVWGGTLAEANASPFRQMSAIELECPMDADLHDRLVAYWPA